MDITSLQQLGEELKEFEADLAQFANVALVAPTNVKLERSGELRQIALQMLSRTRRVIGEIEEAAK